MNTQEILDLINIKIESLKKLREEAYKLGWFSLGAQRNAAVCALEQLKEQIEIAENNRKD